MKAQNYIKAEQRRFRRAAKGQAWSVKDLPQFYYHRNFCDMLTYVSTRYTDLMGPEHTRFIQDFDALPFEAQCTYARIAGRKGKIFNMYHLRYVEIKNIPEQFDTLLQNNFVKPVESSDFKDFLLSMTKPDLVQLIEERLCETLYRRSWKKSKLIDICLEHIDFDDVLISDSFVVQSRLKAYQYLLFLYFGRIENSLQAKTLGDLGVVRPTRNVSPKLAFTNYSQAKCAYFYAKALFSLGANDQASIQTLIDTVELWPRPVDELTKIKRGKLLQKLGGLSERKGNIEAALGLYAQSDSDNCNERVVRIRYRRNENDDRNWVQKRLEEMIENPESDDEHTFANDFYARKFKKKRTSEVTDLLRESHTIFLDEGFRHAPERAVVNYYKKKGLAAYRTENQLWLSLFGLLFWDEIYADEAPKAWSLPLSLKKNSFYQHHKKSIESKLSDLALTGSTLLPLLKTITKHHNTKNGVFNWDPKSVERIKLLVRHAPKAALVSMLRHMAQNFMRTKDGFPDLMLIEHGEARFVEVKAKGDVLRRNQLTRLRQLQAAGFTANIIRVEWHIDPDQVYVVVDVETTGGRPGLHRVTEIGAVKLQNGEIIGEWSSLINPQRSIPSNITRITGIDENMVADAPIFAEIADSFTEFMGDAIFAAHNVNFDYGFIRSEFQMIDRNFKHPKICTCASMRKLYPGYPSYSLKNLCLEFQIDLEAHHRALCDAKAAAELLNMVNDKRIDIQTE